MKQKSKANALFLGIENILRSRHTKVAKGMTYTHQRNQAQKVEPDVWQDNTFRYILKRMPIKRSTLSADASRLSVRGTLDSLTITTEYKLRIKRYLNTKRKSR